MLGQGGNFRFEEEKKETEKKMKEDRLNKSKLDEHEKKFKSAINGI